jgi:tRNA threonylcarbamoyladenosine biosynthesis protein TsaB
MKILALDASSRACSAALIVDGRVAAHRLLALDRGQAEALIPLAAEVLAEAGLVCSGADVIACTVGPGSFTGLRIGLAAARGLVLATGKPFAGVTSFEALARAIPCEGRKGRTLLAAVDAKRAELFVQFLNEALEPLGDPLAVLPEEIAGHVPGGPLFVVGDGAGRLKDALAGRADCQFGNESNIDARWVGLAAHDRLSGGRLVLPPEPLYLRAPDVTLAKSKSGPLG